MILFSSLLGGLHKQFTVKLLVTAAMLFLLLISHPIYACEAGEQCIEENQWSVGLAVGLGAKTNPLVDGQTIPQIVLLDIAWYGEKAYFDNIELGYRWLDDESIGFESYLTLDRERMFFTFWDPINILVGVSDTAVDPPLPVDPDNSLDISINEVSTRQWAGLFGNRLHYYNGSHKLSLSFETGVTGAHKGQILNLSYKKVWRQNNWQFQVKTNLTWKSDELIDYYYGIGEKDNIPSSHWYTGKGGIQAGVSLYYNYKLSEQWQFMANTSYQRLHAGMVNSPLVDKKHTSALFVGFGYRF